MSAENSENLYAIHEAFAATEYGQKLAAQVRYDVYKPDDVSNERWVQVLGADVNNLKHLPLTYGLTKAFINNLGESPDETLTPRETKVLKVSALIHDWAESIVGDINYNDKTDADTEEEKRQLAANLDNFYTGESEEIADIIDESLETVIFSEDGKLAQMFNVVERLGYLRTGLRASEQAFRGNVPDCRMHLQMLSAGVLGTQTPELLEHAKMYTPAQKYLSNQADVIDRAFQAVVAEPEVFMLFPEEKRPVRQQRFIESRDLWLTEGPIS